MEKEVNRLIDLAEQIGGEGWPLLVESTFNRGITNLLVFLITGILLIVLAHKCGSEALKQSSTDRAVGEMLTACSLVLLITGVIMALSAIGVNVPNILCPECEAARALLPRAYVFSCCGRRRFAVHSPRRRWTVSGGTATGETHETAR